MKTKPGLRIGRFWFLGNKIIIYENGQRYEIDSALIYVPVFERENKNDTESKELIVEFENGATWNISPLGNSDKVRGITE